MHESRACTLPGHIVTVNQHWDGRMKAIVPRETTITCVQHNIAQAMAMLAEIELRLVGLERFSVFANNICC